MARRKKKSAITNKILVIGGCLLLLQVVLYFIFTGTRKTLDIRQAIVEQVNKKKDLPSARKEQLKVQLAVNDFMIKNGGKPPSTLQQLIPIYFDKIPIDPATNKPFEYHLDNNRPFVGATGSSTTMAANRSLTPGAASGDGKSLSEAEQQALVASLAEKSNEDQFTYNPVGKRDPFRPFDLAPKVNLEGKTALEHFSLGQLKLTAVLDGFDEPRAIVEDLTGRGYTIKKGTKIGPNNGEVVEIQKDKILILETTVDFSGKANQNTIEMGLRTQDQQTGAQ